MRFRRASVKTSFAQSIRLQEKLLEGQPRTAVKVPPLARLIAAAGPHRAGTETEPWYTSELD